MQERQRRVSGRTSAQACAWPRVLAGLPPGTVPPFPGPSVVPSVVVPPPPRLAPETPLHERARIVARSYAGAVEKRYGKRCWTFNARADVRRSKHYVALAECAEALTNYHVAPAAWCAFSVDVWRKYVTSAKQPPVSWVCSADRVDERREWFLAELPRYDGGQLWVSDAHCELLARWWRMKAAVLRLVEGGGSLARVAKLVQRHFPTGVWDVLVEGACVEARKARVMLLDEAAEGKCLW